MLVLSSCLIFNSSSGKKLERRIFCDDDIKIETNGFSYILSVIPKGALTSYNLILVEELSPYNPMLYLLYAIFCLRRKF